MSLHPYMTVSVVDREIQDIRSRHTDLGMRMMERPAGIGPASRAWEARVLPLYDGRIESNDARPLPLLGELAFGVPLEHLSALGAR